MGVSLTYLSLVILFNSFFMSNFLIIRALRRHMDATFRYRHDNNTVVHQTSQTSLKGTIHGSKFLRFFFGPALEVYKAMTRKYEGNDSNECDGKVDMALADERDERDGQADMTLAAETEKRDQKLDMTLAFCFGYTRKRRYESRRFPNWDPLPLKLGAFTTIIVIVIFAIIFSDSVLNNVLGLDSDSTSPLGGMCMDNEMGGKVQKIKGNLLEKTQLAAALLQTQISTLFLDAIQRDSNLWGTGNHVCKNEPSNKAAFRKSPEYGREFGFSFFPGVCKAAQEFALEKARSQTCMKNYCNVGKVINKNSIIPQNGAITGLDQLGSSLDAVLESSHNLEAVCKECPNSKWEAFGTGARALFGEKPRASAHIVGVGKLEDNLNSLEDAGLSIGIEDATVTYGYKDESFCGSHKVLCPDFSKYDELSELVQDVRLANIENFANPDVSVPTVPVPKVEINDTYYVWFKLLLWQLEIATYIYSAYKCLSLFFPAPILVFKANFIHEVREYLFGVGKYKFLVTVVAIWWAAQYFQSFPLFTQLDLFVKVLMEDPCVARQEYVTRIGESYSTVCNSLISTESEWSNNQKSINDVFQLIEPMQVCCSPYPNEFLADFTELNENNPNMTDYGFEKGSSSFCNDCFLPINDSKFLGDMTACEDYDFVREEIIELKKSSTLSWWDIWISSGVFASLMIRPVVANFGISLAKLADPLMVCDGKYEGPPKGFNFQESEVLTLMEEVTLSLKFSAFGRVFFWGILLNLLFLNVALGKMKVEATNIQTEDALVSGFILAISVVTVIAAAQANKLLSRRILLFAELAENNQNVDTDESATNV